MIKPIPCIGVYLHVIQTTIPKKFLSFFFETVVKETKTRRVFIVCIPCNTKQVEIQQLSLLNWHICSGTTGHTLSRPPMMCQLFPSYDHRLKLDTCFCNWLQRFWKCHKTEHNKNYTYSCDQWLQEMVALQVLNVSRLCYQLLTWVACQKAQSSAVYLSSPDLCVEIK